ncbi:MAG TPA: TlpA disulfide reductase family protein [Gemmatimonadaceae bacterium]
MKIARWISAWQLVIAPMALGAQESGIAVGSDAPGAAVETLDGKPVDLADYVKKGPTLLQFWATWCSNCKALEPRINAAMKKYEGRIRFVAVAVSVNQTVDRVKAYRDKYQMHHDIVYDRRGYAADAYEVAATSYIVVVDGKGKVVYTGLGADQDIEAAVARALK